MTLKSLIIKYVEVTANWRNPDLKNPPFDGPQIKILMKNKHFFGKRIKVLSGILGGEHLFAEKLVYIKNKGTEALLSCDNLSHFFKNEFNWDEIDIHRAYNDYKAQNKITRLNKVIDFVRRN